jgi:hypothetical protein
MTSPSTDPEQTVVPDLRAPSGSPAAADPAAADVRVTPVREPLLPDQSREDTDATWGEYPERADDRLYRDRPPHWADF